MSKINLQRGKLTVENRKSGRLKSKNGYAQSRRRKGRLWWERFVEKESFKPGVEE